MGIVYKAREWFLYEDTVLRMMPFSGRT